MIVGLFVIFAVAQPNGDIVRDFYSVQMSAPSACNKAIDSIETMSDVIYVGCSEQFEI